MASISTGDARLSALSCSIQLSSRQRCNGKCKFCISRTTANIVEDKASEAQIRKCDIKRLKVGLNYARTLGATHAILTGKADPTQEDPDYLLQVVKVSREYLPLADLHTNGLLFQAGRPHYELLGHLADAGLTMITFSIASFNSDVNFGLMGIKQDPKELIGRANELGLMVRCSLVVNKAGVKDLDGVMRYVREAGNYGAHAVVIREVWLPNQMRDDNGEVYRWNQAHRLDIGGIQEEFSEIAAIKAHPYHLRARDPLPWGTPVFTIDGTFPDKNHGVNVTFARCDEASAGRIVKSVIHKPDGHGYRNWDSNGDILY